MSKNQSVVNSKEMNIGTVGVKVNYAQKNEIWKKYGFTEVPLMATNLKGEIVGPLGLKLELQSTPELKEPRVACWLPAGQAFIPFEAIDEINEGLEKRIRDTFPDAKKKDFKIEYIKKKPSSKGNTMHWLVQTNVTETVKNSFVKDDQLKLGFAIRNGYNTGVSLGIDIFTFRLICSNGAIARGQDLATQSIKHIGKDPKALLNLFHEGLMTAIEDWREVMQTYNKMATTKLNEKMARHIFKINKKTPDKYFPDYYNIATPEEIKKGKPVVALTAEGKSITLWENFNDMTQPLWRAQDPHQEINKNGKSITKEGISFKGIVKKERYLHNSMAFIVNNPERFR